MKRPHLCEGLLRGPGCNQSRAGFLERDLFNMAKAFAGLGGRGSCQQDRG